MPMGQRDKARASRARGPPLESGFVGLDASKGPIASTGAEGSPDDVRSSVDPGNEVRTADEHPTVRVTRAWT